MPPWRPSSAALITALGVAGCVSGQSEEQREVSPEPGEAAALEPGCAPLSEAAIASLEGEDEHHPCGVALELDGEQLVVRVRAREGEAEAEGAVLGRGAGPKACGEQLRGCELWGVLDGVGPIVFANQRGHESDVPTQVHLGFVDAERLVFVETWYGLPSVSDHTRVGPPWALAPFDCEGELHLLPAPRLVEAHDEPIGEVVAKLAGRWRADDEGLALAPSEPDPRAPDRCRAIVPALP